MPLLDNNSIRKTQSFLDKDIFARSAELLELDGIALLSLEIENEYINAKILDRNYRDVAQMVGRVARILAKTVPIDVKFFRIDLFDYQSGYSISQVTIEREKLRKLELAFDGPAELWKNTKIENSKTCKSSLSLSDSPLTWSFYPDVDVVLFDPHSPINGSLGWAANLSYRLETLQQLMALLNNQY